MTTQNRESRKVQRNIGNTQNTKTTHWSSSRYGQCWNCACPQPECPPPWPPSWHRRQPASSSSCFYSDCSSHRYCRKVRAWVVCWVRLAIQNMCYHWYPASHRPNRISIGNKVGLILRGTATGPFLQIFTDGTTLDVLQIYAGRGCSGGTSI